MSTDPQKVHVRVDILGAAGGSASHLETVAPAEFTAEFEPIYREGDEGFYPVTGFYRQPEMVGADLTLRLRIMRDAAASPDGTFYRIFTDDEVVAPLRVPASDLKMLRETLCWAQTAVADRVAEPSAHLERLGALIAEIDRHRPLGADGAHGDLHTPTCGCDD